MQLQTGYAEETVELEIPLMKNNKATAKFQVRKSPQRRHEQNELLSKILDEKYLALQNNLLSARQIQLHPKEKSPKLSPKASEENKFDVNVAIETLR